MSAKLTKWERYGRPSDFRWRSGTDGNGTLEIQRSRARPYTFALMDVPWMGYPVVIGTRPSLAQAKAWGETIARSRKRTRT